MIRALKKLGRLEIIVFIAGAVVMILELVASRLLAPYLGTSIYVWASLIGIILGALTVGYYFGGRFSMINPNLAFLANILFLSGLTILLIGLVKEPVLNFAMSLGVKAGSVFSTLLLFTFPSLLLGMVSPYAIRLKVENIEGAGSVAGNLYALSTIGSIAGTFLAGFYLIPAFGSSQILFGLSFTLILASLIGGQRLIKIIALGLLLIFWLTPSSIAAGLVYEGDSAYNHIRVIDTANQQTQRPVRVLYLATEAHSVIYRDSDEVYSPYTHFYRLDSLFKPDIASGLTLGGGAYIAPLDFLKRFPKAKMTVVEIDPQVTAVAGQYFNLRPDDRLKIVHQDGRIFLNNNQEKYDAIYGDAFASYFSVPFQLTTSEAIKEIYDALNPDGIFLMNVISSLDGQKALFLQAEFKTISQYFPQIYLFPAYYLTGPELKKHQNIILMATKSGRRLTTAELLSRASDEQKKYLEHLWENDFGVTADTPALTDDFAPVDYYISKFLDD